MRLEKIKKSDIDPSTWTIRTTSDEKALKLLTNSIHTVGLIQPIVVRPNPEKKGRYLITAGNRRLKSYEEDDFIDCIVLEQSEFQAKLTGLIENYIRVNLPETDHERVITEIYYEGMKNKEWTSFSEMGRLTGIPRETINSHINAYNDRKKLKMVDQPNVSTTDIIESRPLASQPELRKKLLKQRANGELKPECHIVHKTAKNLVKQQKTINPNKLDQFVPSTITVAPATIIQPTFNSVALKESEKTQTPPQTTTPSVPDKPPETTLPMTISVKIDEKNQNKPYTNTQIPVAPPLEPIQEYTSEATSPKNLQTIYCKEAYTYLNLLKKNITRGSISIESSYAQKELISWLKEIKNRIDELLQIVEGKTFFP